MIAVVAWSTSAHAEATIVLLGRSPLAGAAPEFVNRLQGELAADGFQVLLTPNVAAADRSAAVLRAALERSARVAAGVFVEGDGPEVELVLVDALANRVSRRRPPLPADTAEPEPAARRTVEFLRAQLIDFLVDSLREASPPVSNAPPETPPPPLPAPPRHESRGRRWGLEAGAASLFSFQGLGPAVAPTVRARLEPIPALALRLGASWFSTRPTVRNRFGSADVEQGIALAEGVVTLWSAVRGPFVRAGAGVGVYYVGVDGHGVAGHPGERNSTFAAAFDGGLGVGTAIGPRFEMILEGHALVSEPGVGVRFVDSEAARVGRPTLVLSLTVAAWLSTGADGR